MSRVLDPGIWPEVRLTSAAKELYFAPASAALLGGKLGYRWMRFIIKHSSVYQVDARNAWAQAREFVDRMQEEEFCTGYRLTRLADHADLYLSLTRRDGWMRKNLRVSGEWPRAGKFIATTCHWGNGFWSLRHLNAMGYRPAFLSAQIGRSKSPIDLRTHYAQMRNREVARACGAPVIYTGGSIDRIRQHLAVGDALVALLDLPPAGNQKAVSVRLLDRPSRLPRGVFRLAVELEIPLVPFSIALDSCSGVHHLVIEDPIFSNVEDELAQMYARFLESRVQSDPAAWHFWPIATGFFSKPCG